MNKRLMSILTLAIFAIGSVPHANAGGGDFAGGAAAGFVGGTVLGLAIGSSTNNGDPVAKEEAADMRQERRERERREKEARRERKRRERQARKNKKNMSKSSDRMYNDNYK